MEPPFTQVVTRTRSRLHKALELTRDNIAVAQAKMKAYDRKAKVRTFEPWEVLALLPLQGKSLAAKFSGPYVVKKKVGDLDYLFVTPDRCQGMQLCHVNMLKPYYRSVEPSVGSGAVTIVGGEERESDSAVVTDSVVSGGVEQENSRVVQKESIEQ